MNVPNDTSRTSTSNTGNEAGSGAPALLVRSGDSIVFSSTGKWLHPLFDLERFLQREGLDAQHLAIEDKIIGKAAAFLILHMGFRTVHGRTMSRLAEAVFSEHQINYSYDTLVDRIECMTETLLADVEDERKAYDLVRERAKQ